MGRASRVVVLVVGLFLFARDGDGETRYVTQEVTRGDMTVTVTATGNLEPRNQVDIGSELSGTVRAVNVDVNDDVKAGQVLAVLDTTRLRRRCCRRRARSHRRRRASCRATRARRKRARTMRAC